MLLQDHAGGLEVEDPHNPGEFKVSSCFPSFRRRRIIILQQAATPIPGSLVINAGDFLMRCMSWISFALLQLLSAEQGPTTPFEAPFTASVHQSTCMALIV